MEAEARRKSDRKAVKEVKAHKRINVHSDPGRDHEPMWLLKMDVDALCMETEAPRKKPVSRTTTATKREAARKSYDGKGKTVFMTREEKLKLELDDYLEWKRKKEADECDPMSEEVTDPYAFEARSFKQRWEEIYGAMGYGDFDDTTE